MPTRNVVITDQQAKLIDTLVSSGRYQNASEVLREGLRLIKEHEAEQKAKLKALRDAAQTGLSDVEAGRYRAFASFDEMDRHLRQKTNQTLSKGRRR